MADKEPRAEQGKEQATGIVLGGADLFVTVSKQDTIAGIPLRTTEQISFIIRYQGQQQPPYKFVMQVAAKLAGDKCRLIAASLLPQGWVRDVDTPVFGWAVGTEI